MIASILWKEYREQRTVWVAVVLLAVVLTLVLPQVLLANTMTDRALKELLFVALVTLAWTYGVVCGAMLLAGEREGGTQPFLDTLPMSASRIWRCKVLAGGLFQLLLVVVLSGIGLTLQFHEFAEFPLAILILAVSALFGYGWGLLCSSLSRTVLGAVGLAILCQIISIPILQIFCLIPLGLFVGLTDIRLRPMGAIFLGTFLALVFPWIGSLLLLANKERERGQDRPTSSTRFAATRQQARVVIWLATRNVLRFAIGLGLFSMLAALPLTTAGLFVWPILTLMIGALCGVTVFHEEMGGYCRFLGEQRFPLSLLWLGKAATRGIIALLAVSLVLTVLTGVALLNMKTLANPNAQHISWIARVFHSILLEISIPVGLYLLAPVVYGFATGHLAGLLFRKPLVALVVAIGLAGLLLSIWVPSFLAGGLHAWQVFAVPILMIVSSRLILSRWVNDDLANWKVVRLLGTTTLIAVGWTAFSLWYRVTEIPDRPPPQEVQAYLASLPTLEENKTGATIRSALSQFELLSRSDFYRQPADRRLFPQRREQGQPLDQIPMGMVSDTYFQQAIQVVERGWPSQAGAGKELANWLNEVFKDACWKELARLPSLPPGMIEDPRHRNWMSREQFLEPAKESCQLLAARGLQRQAERDPSVFVDHLDIALSLVRNLHSGGSVFLILVGDSITATQMRALDRWLEALDGHPDLLRRVGEILQQHRDWYPENYQALINHQYVITKNSMDNPSDWMEAVLPRIPDSAMQHVEMQMLVAAWRVPWERERHERMTRLMFKDPGVTQYYTSNLIYRMGLSSQHQVQNLEKTRPRRLLDLEMVRLKVACRLYQATTGKPAASLQQLVPACIASIPPDPFDGSPMRYRLSTGEEIPIGWENGGAPQGMGGALGGDPGRMGGAPGGMQMEAPPVLKVLPGQGVLWSVGVDRRDDRGKVQARTIEGDHIESGMDLIYLVPMPARAKKP